MKVNMFLDSGAYSAFAAGTIINIDDYISFVKKYKHNNIEVYANLDVINNSEGTLKNQQIMEEAGLHPLPVYHAGESKKILFKLMDKYDFFALGGAALMSSVNRRLFYNMVFSEVTDKEGFPKWKIHGFGMTNALLMSEYPWYSVDSTSWVKMAAYGDIIFPKWDVKLGNFNYTQRVIMYTGNNPSIPQHISHFNSKLLRYVKDYLDLLDIDIDSLIDTKCKTACYGRDIVNAVFFQRLTEQITKENKPFNKKIKLKGLF